MDEKRTIKFRFSDERIYELKDYKGGSELIDNLEVGESDFVNVVEDLKYEDFEGIETEYTKFMKFRNCILDVITRRREITESEFFSLESYNINGPIFNYLMITENEEERRTRDYLECSKRHEIELEQYNGCCIIGYYFVISERLALDSKPSNYYLKSIIRKVCFENLLSVLKWLYEDKLFNQVFDFQEIFEISLKKNHLDIIKWLFQISEINPSVSYSEKILIDELNELGCVDYNKEEITNFLVHPNPITRDTFEYVFSKLSDEEKKKINFEKIFENGFIHYDLDVLKYICEVGELDFGKNAYQYVIICAGNVGSFEKMKWFLELLKSMPEIEYSNFSNNPFNNISLIFEKA